MEERKLIDGSNKNASTILGLMIVSILMAVLFLWSAISAQNSRQYHLVTPMIIGCCVFIPLSVILIVLYLYVKGMKIVVTDKRVYGVSSFGKHVDLPFDSVSAVGTSWLKGIAVGTSSGKINFLGISNRDEVYEEIKKLLSNRQSKEVKATTPITNITQEQSSADELKKFKDLLDSGIITQEEFDAKKKQLLGL